MKTRSRPIRMAACLFGAAVFAVGCQKPHYKTEPMVRDGRLEELMASPPGYDTQAVGHPDAAQKLTDLNAELRARYEEELRKALQRIEQPYRIDKGGPMRCEPLRSEPPRSIWDTRPEYAP